jgi:hypothetical protein
VGLVDAPVDSQAAGVDVPKRAYSPPCLVNQRCCRQPKRCGLRTEPWAQSWARSMTRVRGCRPAAPGGLCATLRSTPSAMRNVAWSRFTPVDGPADRDAVTYWRDW